MNSMSRWLRATLLAGLLLAGTYGWAADRILSAVPGATPGDWTVTVQAGKEPSFTADGEGVTATVERAGDGIFRAQLSGVAPAARILVMGGAKPAAAIPLRGATTAEAPFNDWAVYHIMMAYFANGAGANDRAGMRKWVHRNYAGGDLQGVLSKADYIADLGVNAVWLSPIFQSETSHGYDVQNYYRVSDALAVPGEPEASLALLRQLRDALGERGVGVVLDVPLNHAARSYDKRSGDPNRLRPRGTRAKQEAEKVWEGWNAGFQYWNFGDEDTRRFLTEVAMYWLNDEQMAGLRLDYVRGVPHDYWAELYAAVKAERPDAILFGEAWKDADGPTGNMTDIANYYAEVPGVGYQFDSLIEFPLQMVMTDVFAKGGDATQLERWLQATEAAYGDHGAPIYFLDNHDTARFADFATDRPDERIAAAVAFMATLPGPMIVYYGTETGLAGSTPQRGFTDTNRYPMPWDDLDESLVARVRDAIVLKRKTPVLNRGSRLPVFADETGVVMARVLDDDVALVAVNTGPEARTIEFKFPAGAGFEALLGPAPAGADGRWRWELSGLSTAVAVGQ
jgi:alpha-amylase